MHGLFRFILLLRSTFEPTSPANLPNQEPHREEGVASVRVTCEPGDVGVTLTRWTNHCSLFMRCGAPITKQDRLFEAFESCSSTSFFFHSSLAQSRGRLFREYKSLPFSFSAPPAQSRGRLFREYKSLSFSLSALPAQSGGRLFREYKILPFSFFAPPAQSRGRLFREYKSLPFSFSAPPAQREAVQRV
ncbi:UNVERIFIED_CONTAM: hypothetical protein FKN15_022432 [Acipenser sinensis]